MLEIRGRVKNIFGGVNILVVITNIWGEPHAHTCTHPQKSRLCT